MALEAKQIYKNYNNAQDIAWSTLNTALVTDTYDGAGSESSGGLNLDQSANETQIMNKQFGGLAVANEQLAGKAFAAITAIQSLSQGASPAQQQAFNFVLKDILKQLQRTYKDLAKSDMALSRAIADETSQAKEALKEGRRTDIYMASSQDTPDNIKSKISEIGYANLSKDGSVNYNA